MEEEQTINLFNSLRESCFFIENVVYILYEIDIDEKKEQQFDHIIKGTLVEKRERDFNGYIQLIKEIET